MEKKWNLQDIRPASKPTRQRSSERVVIENTRRPQNSKEDEEDGTVRIQVENGTKKTSHGYMYLGLAAFLVIGGIFTVSWFMSGSELTVYPKHKEPNVNANFTAYATPQVEELAYELLVLEADQERQVKATGEEAVKEQATGEIEIFNETTNTERLIKNTRFESTDGLVFKTTESVVIPAAQKNATGEMIPGTIMAKVFAVESGEQYNLTPTTFRIPGYKEKGFTELYEKIHARNTQSFNGGFDGPKFIINETELETAKQALHQDLRDALLSRVDSEKPAGFVLFKDAITFTFEALPSVEYGENLVTIKEKALLRVPVFKTEDFAQYIAAATIPGYEGKPVRIDNYTDMTFAYTQATTSSTDISSLTSLDFKLAGKPEIVWTFDEGKLKADLVGVQKTALLTILGGYPAIEKAEAKVRPFWKRTFPTDIQQITIIESLETPQ